jgi:Fur family ferric uptake transcriptional regulator
VINEECGKPANRRNTRQREVILDELRKSDHHPTAAELYERARRRLPRISLGTVYRNLELLTRERSVRKLKGAGREARFDGNLERHGHVRCLHCGRLEDVPGLDGLPAEEDFARTRGYLVMDYRLELIGVCPDCQANGGPDMPGDDLPTT